MQFNRISWYYLNYMLDVYGGPLYPKIPQPVKEFFTTLYDTVQDREKFGSHQG